MKPREKFLKYGAKRLEGSELVAILLGSGIKNNSVFSIGQKVNKVLERKRDKLHIDDLKKIKGIGPTKAIQIMSSFELAKRYFIHDSNKIQSVDDVLSEVHEWRNKRQEHLLCLTLDGADRLIQKRVITIGLLNKSLIHPREIFVDAITDRANSIILVHNHPSGSREPSNEDIRVTHIIKEASTLIGIKLIDHVITTKNTWYSFKQGGLL